MENENYDKTSQVDGKGDKKRSKNNSTFFAANMIGTIIVGIILSIIYLFVFIKPAIRLSAKYNDAISVYEKTAYDFRVYNPIDEQVDELRGNTSVAAAFEYYSYSAVVTSGSKSYNTHAVFSANENDLNVTAYNEQRLISGSAEVSEKDILIDKSCADVLGVSVGDKLSVRIKNAITQEFTVKGIFEDNRFYDNGSVYFQLVGNVKSAVDNAISLSLAGVMIKAENVQECSDFLKTYKPLGEMLPREYFSSNAEYEAYKNEFMNTDYSSRIYNKAVVLSSLTESDEFAGYLANSQKYLIAGSVIYSVLMLLPALKIIFAKRYAANYTKVTKTIIPTKAFMIKFLIADVIACVAGAVILTIGVSICLKTAIIYAGFKWTVYLSYALAAVASFVVLLAIEWLGVTKINRKNH